MGDDLAVGFRDAPAILAVGWNDDEFGHTINGDMRHVAGVPAIVRSETPRETREGVLLEASPAVRILLTKEAAAEMLSMSVDSFERHVMGEIKTVRVGAMVRVPVSELESWVARTAARALRT